ncbi:MAG: hypothetical protein P4L79_00540 [Legionella sp.]|uniref:hypothetical protein n=1 Tax=Legionella sp. TaxID=459 RepID=UPI002845C2A6|nr:hypothetical protein [Legionella sp.]
MHVKSELSKYPLYLEKKEQQKNAPPQPKTKKQLLIDEYCSNANLSLDMRIVFLNNAQSKKKIDGNDLCVILEKTPKKMRLAVIESQINLISTIVQLAQLALILQDDALEFIQKVRKLNPNLIRSNQSLALVLKGISTVSLRIKLVQEIDFRSFGLDDNFALVLATLPPDIRLALTIEKLTLLPILCGSVNALRLILQQLPYDLFYQHDCVDEGEGFKLIPIKAANILASQDSFDDLPDPNTLATIFSDLAPQLNAGEGQEIEIKSPVRMGARTETQSHNVEYMQARTFYPWHIRERQFRFINYLMRINPEMGRNPKYIICLLEWLCEKGREAFLNKINSNYSGLIKDCDDLIIALGLTPKAEREALAFEKSALIRIGRHCIVVAETLPQKRRLPFVHQLLDEKSECFSGFYELMMLLYVFDDKQARIELASKIIKARSSIVTTEAQVDELCQLLLLTGSERDHWLKEINKTEYTLIKTITQFKQKWPTIDKTLRLPELKQFMQNYPEQITDLSQLIFLLRAFDEEEHIEFVLFLVGTWSILLVKNISDLNDFFFRMPERVQYSAFEGLLSHHSMFLPDWNRAYLFFTSMAQTVRFNALIRLIEVNPKLFNNMSLIQAKELLSQLPCEQRGEASQVLLAIPGSLLPNLLTELNAFLQESNAIGQAHRFFRYENVSNQIDQPAQTKSCRHR